MSGGQTKGTCLRLFKLRIGGCQDGPEAQNKGKRKSVGTKSLSHFNIFFPPDEGVNAHAQHEFY